MSVYRIVLTILLKLYYFFFSKEELKEGYQQEKLQGSNESQVDLGPCGTLNIADSTHW